MMFRCKQGDCPRGNGDMCCHDCTDRDGCSDACDQKIHNCGLSEQIEDTGVIPFQSKAMAIMQKIVDLNIQKKQLEAQDKDVRQQLEKVMGEYGIKQFENDLLKVTYVEPTTRTTIDSAKLKKELPAVAEKYTKVSQVKGSVRIEVK